jgi:hemoglobin
MASTDPTLYRRLGGGTAIRAVIERFFAGIVADPELGPIFEPVDIPDHVARTSAFVGWATGSGEPWDGRDLAAAHRDLDITSAQFDRVAGHLADALAAAGVPADLARELVRVVGSLRSQIVVSHASAIAATSPQLRRSPTFL